jgi:hypothetical protein
VDRNVCRDLCKRQNDGDFVDLILIYSISHVILIYIVTIISKLLDYFIYNEYVVRFLRCRKCMLNATYMHELVLFPFHRDLLI